MPPATFIKVDSIALSSTACVDPATCGGNQTESVSLSFARIRWSYIPDTGGGKPGPAIEFCWDAVGNGPC